MKKKFRSKSLPRKTTIQVTTQTARATSRKTLGGDFDTLSTEQKKQAALELRLEHHSEKDIGIALGVSRSRVSQLLKEALADMHEANANMIPYIRDMEVERCDRQILHWFPEAKVNIKASQLLLHWTERKHKILGIEVNKTELSGRDGGAIRINASALDLTKLNDQELEWLEVIIKKAGPQLPADDQRVIEHDTTGGSTNDAAADAPAD